MTAAFTVSMRERKDVREACLAFNHFACALAACDFDKATREGLIAHATAIVELLGPNLLEVSYEGVDGCSSGRSSVAADDGLGVAAGADDASAARKQRSVVLTCDTAPSAANRNLESAHGRASSPTTAATSIRAIVASLLTSHDAALLAEATSRYQLATRDYGDAERALKTARLHIERARLRFAMKAAGHERMLAGEQIAGYLVPLLGGA